jgi:hypothetical protein
MMHGMDGTWYRIQYQPLDMHIVVWYSPIYTCINHLQSWWRMYWNGKLQQGSQFYQRLQLNLLGAQLSRVQHSPVKYCDQ